MSDQMNMDAERAAFEASGVVARLYRNNTPGGTDYYEDGHTELAWRVWQAARRTAPSAPMGEELPAPHVVRIHKFGRKGTGKHEYEMSDGSIAVMNELEALASAAYHANSLRAKDERIRQLERELAERKTGSIDTPEFWQLLSTHVNNCDGGPDKAVLESRAALIAHIDGRTAGAALDGWKLVPVEPTEAMVHAAQDLPAPRMFGVVYRAMIAAAPSPQQGKEGGND